jgi:1-acyl-sn-glycerol-3-phosphate acyltransferase
MHGYIYIILKESLKNVPIIGWGAQFYNFIFLSRKWEADKKQFQAHLDTLNKPTDPMWLLIFPEGTNLAKSTREASKRWADKSGVQDMKHQLLPRSRGLQFCLQRLKTTTEWLYDCTIAYEGIAPGEFGQDTFTLRSSMFEGRPPKSVNMHFRRFHISTIPVDNDKAFDVWVRNRWREKDYLLEHFVRFNRFPDDDKWMTTQKKAGRTQFVRQPARFIETQIKSNNLEEFLSIFAPLTSVMTVIFLCYGGANPKELMKMLEDAGQKGKNQVGSLVPDSLPKQKVLKSSQQTNGRAPDVAAMEALGKMIPPAAQKELIQKYLEGIRPAVASQINLPKNALRIPNAANSTSNQRAKSVNLAASTQNRVSHPPRSAPSIINSPTTKSLPAARPSSSIPTKAKSTVSARKAPSLSVAASATAASQRSRPTKLGTTNKPVAPSVQKVDKTTFDRSRSKSVAPTGLQNHNTSSSSKGVTIDPKFLAKMKLSNEKGKESKRVTIDPKALAKMKGFSEKKS